jgi:hypothetical protein
MFPRRLVSGFHHEFSRALLIGVTLLAVEFIGMTF